MDLLHASCAGLDVHKETVVACVRRRDANGKVQQQTRTFGTMTGQLLELADWLAEQEVTHVAMESTGVYGKPIWNLLEDPFEILLVNVQHIKQVPGRKTDVKDAEWIAQLLQHDLLRGSFVPSTPQRELRELTRQRRQLIQARAAVAFACSQKTLPVALLLFESYFKQEYPLAVLPLVFYHAGQLVVDTVIAERLAGRTPVAAVPKPPQSLNQRA